MTNKNVLASTAVLAAMLMVAHQPAAAIYLKGSAPQPGQVNTLTMAKAVEQPENFTYQLQVNNHMLPHQAVYITPDDHMMVALRTVAEKLDYQLTWEQATKTVRVSNENRHIQLKIGELQYTEEEITASLPIAPVLIDSTTYVPLSFLQEGLATEVTVSETGVITVSAIQADHAKVEETQEMSQSVTKAGTITKITASGVNRQLELNGWLHGIRLTISDETEIRGLAGELLTIDDLVSGMAIQVVHEPIMALSLPPMTHAKSIQVTQAVQEEKWGTAGDITKVDILSHEQSSLTVKGEKIGANGYEEIVLQISDDTEIIRTSDNQPVSVGDLKAGQKVYVFYGGKVTRSLPPIGIASKILVETE